MKKFFIIIPLTILFLISYSVFVYPFDVVTSWIGYQTSFLESLITSIIVFFVCLYYLRSKSSNKFLKTFVYEGVGIGSLSLLIVLGINIINYFFPISDFNKMISYGCLLSILLAYGYWNAKNLSIKSINFTSPLIKKSKKFVFISDIHIGSNPPKTLLNIVKYIQKLKPEFVLIGGDLFDSSSFKIQDVEVLKNLEFPIYFVTGNHEYYVKNHLSHLNNLHSLGVKILDNQSLQLDEINLIGISDNQSRDQKISIFESLYNKNLFNLLLVHQPSIWQKVRDRANLMLSGHTHNGQIFPFNLMVRLQFPEKYGRYSYLNNELYVSSGAATWGPKLRIGSNNEIVEINLKAS